MPPWPWTDHKKVEFVNLTTLPIGPAELKTAFAVSENILWWRALMQTLETRKQDALDAAANYGEKGIESAAFMEVGKAKLCADVIADLQKLRRASVTE